MIQIPRFLIAAWLLMPLAHAGQVQIITQANIADRVRNQNPELKAARFLIDEALGRLHQSGRLANPDLEFSIENDFRLREGTLDVGVAQRFPVTSRLRLEKDIRAREWQAAQAEVQDVERRLIADARGQLVRLLALRDRRALLRQQLVVCDQQAELLAAASQRGEMSLAEAGLAKIEAASIQLQLGQLEAGEAGLVSELKRLLGISPAEGLEIGGVLSEPAPVSAPSDPSRRPDYQVARLGAEASAGQVALEQALRYDDVEAGFFMSAMRREDAPEGLKQDVMVGLQLMIPLPIHNDNSGAIQEAKARQKRLDQELDAKARAIALEVEAEQAGMQRWHQVIASIDKELLPIADEQVRLAEQAVGNGQGDVDTLMRVSDVRFELLMSRLDALEEYHQARVRHQAATANP